MKIADRVFIITGAGSGLGKAAADHLLDSGAFVGILDLKEPEFLHPNARFFATDVSNTESVIDGVQGVIEWQNRIDGLVNCAGIATILKTASNKTESTVLDFMKTVDINLTGTFRMIAAATPLMSTGKDDESESGVVINVASVAAYDGQIGQSAYSASKGGVVSMTLPLARELARYRIRVCTIAPGTFETPMMARLPQRARETLETGIPFPKRLGMPYEFAHLVAFLIENTYINGETVRLDGALRMM